MQLGIGRRHFYTSTVDKVTGNSNGYKKFEVKFY